MELLRKIFKTIHRYWVQRSSEAYLNYLRKLGYRIDDTPFSIMSALCLPHSYISLVAGTCPRGTRVNTMNN